MTTPEVVQHVPFASCVEEFRYGTSEKSASSGKPALRIPNVVGGKLNLDELKCFPVDDAEFERLRLFEGDVLFVRTNGNPNFVGRSAIFTRSAVLDYGYDPSEFIYASYLIRARLNQSLVLPEFLCHYLSSPEGRQAVRERCRTSAGQFNINTAGLGTIPLPLPPLREQVRIASILDKADAIRRKREEGIRLTEEVLRSTFLEMFGDPVRNEHSWPIVKVREAGDVQLGRQRAPKYQSGKHTCPYIRVANVFEDRIDLSDLLAMDFNPSDFAAFKLYYGDILLNEGQSTELVGRPAMWRDEIPECCFQNTLVRFRSNLKRTVPEFALEVFLYYLRKGQFARISSKTSSVAHLGAGRFAEMPFPLPPLEMQHEFAARRRKVHELLERRQRQYRETADLFKSLVQRAFRGEL